MQIRFLVAALALAGVARAQVQTLPSDAGQSKAVIDANNTWLNAHVNSVPYPAAPGSPGNYIPVLLPGGAVTYLSVPTCSILGYSPTGPSLTCITTAPPSAHAASHGVGGGDAVTLDTSQTTSGVFSTNRLPGCNPSGSNHGAGMLPDAGSVAGTTRFLREDCTWAAINTGNASQLQGRTVASTGPTNNQALMWNNGNNQWQPTTVDTSIVGENGALYFTAARVYAALSVAALPLHFNSSTGQFSIDQANTTTAGYLAAADWNTFNAKQAAITTGTQDQALNGALGLTSLVNCTASGGVSQYSTASHTWACHTMTPAEIGAATSSATTTVAGASCALGGSCAPASTGLSDTGVLVRTNQSNTFSAGTQDAHAAAHTLPARNGTAAAIPATCTLGEEYFATDATAGQNKYYCTATNTWTQGISGANPGGVTGALQKNAGGGVLAGQGMLYSNIFGAGTERQLGANCTPLITVPYTAFTSSLTFQQIRLATVPAWWWPQSVLLNESTTFTCSGGGCSQVTALAASIGTSSSPSYYVQPMALMGATSPPYRVDNVNGQPASLASHDIYLQVSVANASPGSLGNGTVTSLTAGQLQMAICGGTWQ